MMVARGAHIAVGGGLATKGGGWDFANPDHLN